MILLPLLLLAPAPQTAPLPPSAVATPGAPTDELAELVRARVAPWVDGTFFPGLVVGVVRGDEALVRGYGETAPGSGVTPDGDTLYEIGSLTKLYTGLLLADAQLAGVARLDDPLAVHLGEGVEVPSAGDAPLRLVHLSTHTSGLSRLPPNLDASSPDVYAAYDEAALRVGLAQSRPRTAPGARYAYSNFAVGALGVALARAHGLGSFEALLEARLTGPLGLDDTCLELDEDQAARLAPPFDAALLPTVAWHFDALAGAGAIRASMHDLLAFARLFLDGAEHPLREATQLATRVHARPESGPQMALGWHVIEADGARPMMLAHEGETGGYHSLLLVEPRGGRVVALLANAPSQVLGVMGQDLVRAVCGEPPSPRSVAPVVELPAAALEELPGTYRVAFLDKVEVTREGGRLLARRTNGPRLRLYAVAEDRYECRTYPIQMDVRRDEADAVAGLVLRSPGKTADARRVD